MISHILDRGNKCEGSRHFTFTSQELKTMVTWLGDPVFGYRVIVHQYSKPEHIVNFAGNDIDKARKLYFRLKLEIEIKEIEKQLDRLSGYSVIPA